MSENQSKINEMYTGDAAFVWDLLFQENLHTGMWNTADENISRAEASSRFTRRMIDKLGIQEGAHVLDIGSGLGGSSIELAKVKNCTVDGINISEEQNQRATELARQQGFDNKVKFHHGDATILPFEHETFDAAWFFESLIHVSNYTQAIREASRVLKKDGTLLVVDFPLKNTIEDDDTKQLVKDFHLNALITLDEYRELLGEYDFELIDCEDFTDTAIRSWQRAVNELAEHKTAVVNRGGLEFYEGTKWEFEAFINLLEHHISYMAILARKSA